MLEGSAIGVSKTMIVAKKYAYCPNNFRSSDTFGRQPLVIKCSLTYHPFTFDAPVKGNKVKGTGTGSA